jgi:hypothetical protein
MTPSTQGWLSTRRCSALIWIALAAGIGSLLGPGAAVAFEPQPSPGLEEALAHPPGMPPPPTPSPEGQTTEASPESGPTSPLSTGPLERLAGHGRYWGLSITGANGGHPIRRPRELWLAFGTITDYGGESFEEKIDEYAALFWESNCNEHNYKVEATPTRLNLGGGGSTLVGCIGRVQKEERWLERFFGASPHWRLADGRLTLTARGSRIVMHHRRPRPS